MSKKFCKTFISKDNTSYLEDQINSFSDKYELDIISSSICSHVTHDKDNGTTITYVAIVVFKGETLNNVKEELRAYDILEANGDDWEDIFNPNN